jgi:hypothetical protein
VSDFHERLAKLRAQQEGRSTVEEVGKTFAAFLDEVFDGHEDHPWEQVGRCVVCVPCGTRLYQGTIPEGHPIGHRESKPPRNLLAEFRDRWGQL